jgi:Zn-dependent protease with chaperone function
MSSPPPLENSLPADPVGEEVRKGRRLTTPSREVLLQHYAQTEAIAKLLMWIEASVGVALLIWVLLRMNARGLPATPWPWIAFGIGALGVFRWFTHHLFLNKKRIEHLRPDARFGVHTRDSLVHLAGGVFDRLGLRPDSAPVFLTRAKDINAHAIRCELWPGLHLFNGVFLNRSIIHLLDPPELASVIGHELGHVFPYAPILSRTYLLHSFVAGTASFAAALAFGHPGVALFAPMAILWLLDCLIAFPHARLSRGIEFLCDDHGARAAGLLPALSAEVKVAAEQETRQGLLLRLFEARQAGRELSLHDIADAYEKAVPFGKADPEQFEREVTRLTDAQRAEAKGISLGGFLSHLGGSEGPSADEAAGEQLEELRALEQLPLISLDREPYLRGSVAWTPEAAARLANALENEPNRVLVRVVNEVSDLDVTHPGPSRRVLFLWRNREAYPLRG